MIAKNLNKPQDKKQNLTVPISSPFILSANLCSFLSEQQRTSSIFSASKVFPCSSDFIGKAITFGDSPKQEYWKISTFALLA